MSTLRKDSLGQDINIGDAIAWGNSSRHSGVDTSIVVKYSPKLLGTLGGSTVHHTSCVVITDQLKANKPETLKQMLKDAKDLLIPIDKMKPVKKKLTYQVFIRFFGENTMPASGVKTYHSFTLEVIVFEDGKQKNQHPLTPSVTSNGDYHHQHIISRDRDRVEEVVSWKPNPVIRHKKNGKLVLDEDYSCYRSKDHILTGKLVKDLLGFLPEDDVTLSAKSLPEIVGMFNSDKFRVKSGESYYDTSLLKELMN